MKRFVILCTLTASLVLPSASQAQWTVRPLVPPPAFRTPYTQPMPYPPGSPVNPYILQSPFGDQYRMTPLFQPNPLDPGHRFSSPTAPGTPTNPFMIQPLR